MNVYVDTSAFTKLLLREQGSDEVVALWHRATRIASSQVLYVEARATLAAATRQRKIRAKRALSLREMLESLVDEMHVIDFTPQLAAIAGDVAETYRLRANDAIHLASALSQPPVGLVMMSWDAELRGAAARAGLALAPA